MLQNFIQANGLQQADAIVLKKQFLGMVEHYAIFLGYRGHNPVFVANFTNGVKEIEPIEIARELEKYEPIRIERFEGNYYERQEAVKRAVSRIGERAYSYISNNCEHFKNWVHSGENRSEQVDTAGNAVTTLGVVVGINGLTKGSTKDALLGLAAILVGAHLKNVASK